MAHTETLCRVRLLRYMKAPLLESTSLASDGDLQLWHRTILHAKITDGTDGFQREAFESQTLNPIPQTYLECLSAQAALSESAFLR